MIDSIEQDLEQYLQTHPELSDFGYTDSYHKGEILRMISAEENMKKHEKSYTNLEERLSLKDDKNAYISLFDSLVKATIIAVVSSIPVLGAYAIQDRWPSNLEFGSIFSDDENKPILGDDETLIIENVEYNFPAPLNVSEENNSAPLMKGNSMDMYMLEVGSPSWDYQDPDDDRYYYVYGTSCNYCVLDLGYDMLIGERIEEGKNNNISVWAHIYDFDKNLVSVEYQLRGEGSSKVLNEGNFEFKKFEEIGYLENNYVLSRDYYACEANFTFDPKEDYKNFELKVIAEDVYGKTDVKYLLLSSSGRLITTDMSEDFEWNEDEGFRMETMNHTPGFGALPIILGIGGAAALHPLLYRKRK
jgi:hypothetical protein